MVDENIRHASLFDVHQTDGTVCVHCSWMNKKAMALEDKAAADAVKTKLADSAALKTALTAAVLKCDSLFLSVCPCQLPAVINNNKLA
jgi:hypothetical protein